ncbi:MAG: hypothetical protein AB8B87_17895 [Granulosicoccus sp.]
MEWNQLVWFVIAATAIGGILAGYLAGTRSARKVKRRVQQQMNLQSLELLDAKSTIKQLQASADVQKRKDRLLKLTLTRLQLANKLIAKYRNQQLTSEKKHFIALSRMRLRALEARETARKAASIARKATFHLQRLEKASPITQTIEAPEPKSYGNSDPVTVSVVDQALLDGTGESVAQVSNRDSARLTKLLSSNEATAS